MQMMLTHSFNFKMSLFRDSRKHSRYSGNQSKMLKQLNIAPTYKWCRKCAFWGLLPQLRTWTTAPEVLAVWPSFPDPSITQCCDESLCPQQVDEALRMVWFLKRKDTGFQDSTSIKKRGQLRASQLFGDQTVFPYTSAIHINCPPCWLRNIWKA